MICLRANESEIILHTIFTCVSTLHVYIFQFDDEISYVRAVVRVCVCCLMQMMTIIVIMIAVFLFNVKCIP